MPVHITPLTPLALLERSASVFAEATAVVHGDERITYRELAERVTRAARALRASGVGPGDRVAYLCPNTPALLVAHFAVPLAGGVLVALNTRLAPDEVAAICRHSGARMLIADTALARSVTPVLDRLGVEEVVWDEDHGAPAPAPAGTAYADLLARGSDEPLPWTVDDEDATIAINYTSGTTGPPKGVMYTHRGAYLNALGENITAGHDMRHGLPLDAAHVPLQRLVLPLGDRRRAAARHVCLRGRARRGHVAPDRRGGRHPPQRRADGAVDAGQRLRARPTRSSDRADRDDRRGAPEPDRSSPRPRPSGRASSTSTGSPRPTARTRSASGRPGGTASGRPSAPGCCSRQGVAMVMADPIRVVGPDGDDVPRDGATVGEVVMRGNNVMKGYFDDPEAHRGRLPRRVVPLGRPRRAAPRRLHRAARPRQGHHHLGRREHLDHRGGAGRREPPGGAGGGGDRRAGRALGRAAEGVRRAAPRRRGRRRRSWSRTCRERLAHFKCPDVFEFLTELPRTSTGKVRKFELREREWAGRELRIN